MTKKILEVKLVLMIYSGIIKLAMMLMFLKMIMM
jgi:hypothetical protein